jgi:hypothetical protein
VEKRPVTAKDAKIAKHGKTFTAGNGDNSGHNGKDREPSMHVNEHQYGRLS